MKSYWDMLPDELHQLIYDMRDKILFEEREKIKNSLTKEELFSLLYKNTTHKIESIKMDHFICKTKIYDVIDIFDAINLGMNMNRMNSLNDGQSQTVIHYDSLSYDDQFTLAEECYNYIPLKDFLDLLGDNDDFINLADWMFQHFKTKWLYPN